MMTQDDDGFELWLGRIRSGGSATAGGARQRRLLERMARSGGNPRRLRSVVAEAPRPRSGRFNGRGRGAAVAASIPRSSGWSFDDVTGARVRMRRVTVKARIVKAAGKAGGAAAHLRYLERDGTTRDGTPGKLFSTFSDEADRDAFLERGADDCHQFRFIVAPEDGGKLEELKPFTRDLMARAEQDLGTTLDWVAIEHHDTGHPHVHIVVRGVTEDGKTLNIAGDYIAHGIRHRASEIMTREIGMQSEHEVARQLGQEVDAERLTRLDQALLGRAEDGLVDLSQAMGRTGLGEDYRQLLIGRARTLERMGLAEAGLPLNWRLSPGLRQTLDEMGRRGDIIRTLHAAMTKDVAERSPQLYRIRSMDDEPVVGRIVARGLVDEQADRRYLIVDGIDGHSHYADIGEAEGSFPIGSIVRLSSSHIEPRTVDRTVAEVAAGNGGHYSVDAHLRHDPSASEAFAQAHVRRLEAIRRATGGVERLSDGSWTIASDHLGRVRAYEAQQAERRPVIIETLSPVGIERQLSAEAPTWLDRRLAGEESSPLAPHGYGLDVAAALRQRQQWLVEQGLAYVQGEDVVLRRGALDLLRRRELLRVAGQLSDELSLAFVEHRDGERITGIYRKTVDTLGGRYALVERSKEFSLVPWRPMLERQIGREVSGTLSRGAVDWTIGRGRGLGR
ncbi:type IV secretion system protein VirD2 [Sphingomonas sp. Root710]|nr:type IV secretion system protein VirD2 [Sphingomonas sp. Root710]